MGILLDNVVLESVPVITPPPTGETAPEPGSVALLGIGIAAAGLPRRRKTL